MGARESDGPRVRVAALMLLDGKIVTVRHRAGDSVYHLLPGGGVDYRESLEEALLREIREETGVHAAIGEPVIVNDTIDPDGPRHVVNITFAATITCGTITDTPADPRVEAVDLVDPPGLRSLDLRPPIAGDILAWLSSSERPTAHYAGSVFTREGGS